MPPEPAGWKPALRKSSRPRSSLDLIKMPFRSDEEGAIGHSAGGQRTFPERIGGEFFEQLARLDHHARSLFVQEINPSARMDRRGGIIAPQPFLPMDPARLCL